MLTTVEVGLLNKYSEWSLHLRWNYVLKHWEASEKTNTSVDQFSKSISQSQLFSIRKNRWKKGFARIIFPSFFKKMFFLQRGIGENVDCRGLFVVAILLSATRCSPWVWIIGFNLNLSTCILCVSKIWHDSNLFLLAKNSFYCC